MEVQAIAAAPCPSRYFVSKLALEASVRGCHLAEAKPGVLDVVVLDAECLGHALGDPGDDEPALSLNDGVLQDIHHEDMLAHAAASGRSRH